MLELTPGNLITHLRKLEDAGYLNSETTGTAEHHAPRSRSPARAAPRSTPTPTRSATCSAGCSAIPESAAAVNDLGLTAPP